MEAVRLLNGRTEIIGSHRDVVDIVRDKCGDDVAKIVDEYNSEDWENVYAAYDLAADAERILKDFDKNGSLTSEQVSDVKEKIADMLELLVKVL